MCMYEMFMPEDKEQLALAMNGKKEIFDEKIFSICRGMWIDANLSRKMMMAVIKQKNSFLEMCEESLLPARLKERFAFLIEQRIDILQG